MNPLQGLSDGVELLGRELDDEKIEKVLVEEKLPIATEAYLSVTYSGRKPTVIVSRRGGVDIEEASRERPDSKCLT